MSSKPFSFGNVGAIVTAKAPKKSSAPEVSVEGVTNLAALDMVIASLQSVREDIESAIKDDASSHFISTGCVSKVKPQNYKGVENNDSCSIELRKRSSASKLSDEEIKLCDQLEIGYKVVEEVVDTFVLNPAHLEDAKTMGVLEKLIAAAVAKGTLPADIMLKQDGKSKTVLADDALDTLFVRDAEVVIQALPICGTLAVGKTKFAGTLDAALQIIQNEMGLRIQADPAINANPPTPKKAKKAA